MKAMPIEIKHLQKKYDRLILKDINLSVEQGEYIAILGKSGTGKSTLLNILGLIEQYSSGYFRFGNQDIVSWKDYARLRREVIGFVFQSYNLLPGLSVEDNIRMPLLYNKRSKDRSEEWMERFGITDLRKHNVAFLSGGEKQRVGLARAMMNDPSILLADEPTGNLDTANRDAVFSILKDENQKGRTVILITHDLMATCDAKVVYRLESGVLQNV